MFKKLTLTRRKRKAQRTGHGLDGPAAPAPPPLDDAALSQARSTSSSNSTAPVPVISKGKNLKLHVLRTPPTTCDNVVDVIFIHGITGNAYNTWRHASSGTHWPSELLPKDIPNARIMAWGYDASVISIWGHAGGNRLADHSKNLIGDVVRLREDTHTVGHPTKFP